MTFTFKLERLDGTPAEAHRESSRGGSPCALTVEAAIVATGHGLRINVPQRNPEDFHKDAGLNLLLENQFYTDERERERLSINSPVWVRANVSRVGRRRCWKRGAEVDMTSLWLDDLRLPDHCNLLDSLARRDVVTVVSALENGFYALRRKEGTRHEIAESGSSPAYREAADLLADRQVANDVRARLLRARGRSKRQGRNQGDKENQHALHLQAPPSDGCGSLQFSATAKQKKGGVFRNFARDS